MEKDIDSHDELKVRRIYSPRVAAYAASLALLLTGFISVGCGSKKNPPSSLHSGQAVAAHSKAAIPSSFNSAGSSDNAHQIKILTDALQKKPGHVPVLMQLAGMAAASGKLEEATKYLKEVLAREPGNTEARLELGKILFEMGKIQESIQTTEEILRVQPDNPDALYNLGAIYGNLGNRQRASEYWGRLVASNPQSDSGKRAKQMMSELQKTTP